MVSQVAEMPSVNEVIVHCQKQIKKEPPEDKLLHYLGRLTRLRVTTQDLVETGIGRTVNQLSRHDGDVGSAARKLVRQWKAMVAEESKCSGSDSNSNSSSNEEEDEEEEEEDAEGDEEGDGGAQFVEKEVNSRHSDEDASSHNDQQSVSEVMEEDGDGHDSDVSDRLCIDDEVPTQPLLPQHKEKIRLSSSSDSDSDSDGHEDVEVNHKGSSSESEREEISAAFNHIKQEPIVNNESYDENEVQANNHLEHQLKYDPKSSASSSRHSEDEFSDSFSHSPKRKANFAFPKEPTVENTIIHKSKSTPNESESAKKIEKKYDSSEDEREKYRKHKKSSSNTKPSSERSKEKSKGSNSMEKDKDSKAVVIKKEPMDMDEEYEPEKPKLNSSRDKAKSYESEKSKHRDKDGEKSKRLDRESEKHRSGSKDIEKSKHHDRDREKDKDRSKRYEKSEKSKYNDSEKSKHREKDRDRDRLGSKEKESRSSESKNHSVKNKTESGYEHGDKDKHRSSSREGKSSLDSKNKTKTDSVGYENYSDRERSNHRENKTSDSKMNGTVVKGESGNNDNYYSDRSSSQKSSSGYSSVPSKPESGYDSYSTETDSSLKTKGKSEIKSDKVSGSSSRKDRDRERDEKGKDKKESPQERERKERQREKDKEREKDSRKRKHNGELSDKEEQSSSKKSKESPESNKTKVEVDKSKPKKPKLVIRGEVDSTSGFNFADVLNCLDVSSSKSSSKKKDLKEKSSKKSVISPPTSSKKDEFVPLVRKSDIDKLAAEKKKNRNKNGIIESIIAPTVNISPNYKPATSVAVLPKLPKPTSSAPLSLGSLGLNDPSNWEDSRAILYEENCKSDALSTMMSSRNARTKVFSGNKAALKGEVPKLFDLCMHVIQENIQDLGYTGGVPYDILKPALERATATQLYNIEDCNPYLIEDTDELWKFHSSRDFRNRVPQELESWRELYLRCIDEREARLQSLTSKMKRKVEVAEPTRKTKLAYVETHFGGPRFSKSKAATIKNGMKSLKFREEKGVKRAHGMSAGAGGSGVGKPGGSAGIVEEAAVIISSESKAGSAPAPSVSREPSVAKMKPKKAPLMQKTFKLMKTLCRR